MIEDVRRAPTPTQVAWVERTIGRGARVTNVRRLFGGITSSVHRLSVRTGARSSMQVVLKRFTLAELEDRSAIVRNEAAALTAVEDLAVPAPRLLGSSPGGEETNGVPSLLMTRAPGRAWLAPDDLEPWIRDLASVLPVLHAGAAIGRVRRQRDIGALTVPTLARRRDVWTAAKEFLQSESPPQEQTLVHGDYQHFNVLWSRGRLSAVVDWSWSGTGSPDLDVGHCRLNLAVLFSPDIAERFRSAYETEAGRTVEPWWDIHQLLSYDDTWATFIPVQIARRAQIDVEGMTERVEDLLAIALARF